MLIIRGHFNFNGGPSVGVWRMQLQSRPLVLSLLKCAVGLDIECIQLLPVPVSGGLPAQEPCAALVAAANPDA